MNRFRTLYLSLLRHKQALFFNTIGLAIGLTVFSISVLLFIYENDHDSMFKNRDQIFTVNSIFSKYANENIREYPNTYLAITPHLKKENNAGLEVARSLMRTYPISKEGKAIDYFGVRLVDKEFFSFFNFDFLHGRPHQTTKQKTAILTKSTATKIFGKHAVVDNFFSINNIEFKVAAVIDDVGFDSHFNSSFLPYSSLSIITSIEHSNSMDLPNPDLDWVSFAPTDITYLKVGKEYSIKELESQVNFFLRKFAPSETLNLVEQSKIRPLKEANTQIWSALNLPILEVILLFGILILLASSLNFISSVTILGASRIKEIGLRKAFGASPIQQIPQHFIEILIPIVLAIFLSLTVTEISISLINAKLDKNIYWFSWKLLVFIVMYGGFVSLLAASYLCYSTAHFSPAQCLQKKSGLYINTKFSWRVISTQFFIASYLLSVTAIVIAQNQLLNSIFEPYNEKPIFVIENEDDSNRLITAIKLSLPNAQISQSSGIPFHLYGGQREFTVSGSEQSPKNVFLTEVLEEFFSIYNIPLTHGRIPSNNKEIVLSSNSLEALGIKLENAIGKTIFIKDKEQQLTVVGVFADWYYLGAHVPLKPMSFSIGTGKYISIKTGSVLTKKSIEDLLSPIWSMQKPTTPLIIKTLRDYFMAFYRIPVGLNIVLLGFGTIAIFISFFGILGLITDLIISRARDINLRLLWGATSIEVTNAIFKYYWKTILLAVASAFPFAYFSSQVYLNFYSMRIQREELLLITPILVVLFVSWLAAYLHSIQLKKNSRFNLTK